MFIINIFFFIIYYYYSIIIYDWFEKMGTNLKKYKLVDVDVKENQIV